MGIVDSKGARLRFTVATVRHTLAQRDMRPGPAAPGQGQAKQIIHAPTEPPTSKRHSTQARTTTSHHSPAGTKWPATVTGPEAFSPMIDILNGFVLWQLWCDHELATATVMN